LVGAVLADGADGGGREHEGERFLKLWHVDALFLQVDLLADVSGRVEFGGADAIAIAAGDF